jgi:hypothetical protein
VSYEYNPEIASHCTVTCPPKEAEPTDLVIYRKVNKVPTKDKDFISDIESKKKYRNPLECKHWGCSVWPNEASAAHARELFDWVRSNFIVSGKLVPSDGQIMATPSREQRRWSSRQAISRE